jgi:hypothetical protein
VTPERLAEIRASYEPLAENENWRYARVIVELLDHADELEGRLAEATERAKFARMVAAAPDYDEEAIREALWAVVEALRAEPAKGYLGSSEMRDDLKRAGEQIKRAGGQA